MIIQNNNTLVIQNLSKNTRLTLIRQNGLVINFTNELGETFTVAKLDKNYVNQLVTFLFGG